MKTKLIAILMICLLAIPAMAAERAGSKSSSSSMSAVVNNTTYIDVNSCLMFVTNHGNFARDLAGVFGYDAGTFYPFSSAQDILDGVNDITINYASGIWIGAIDSASGDTLVVISEYDSEYRPGVVINPGTPGATFDPATADPKYRVYKLKKSMGPGDAEYDAYMDFMTGAVSQGAPWVEDTTWQLDTIVLDPLEVDSTVLDIDSIPDMLGDQMLWSVYNDFDPAQHANDAAATAPLGLEIRQTVFGFNREDPLGDVVFIRYQIFNKGVKVLKNCYFSIWDDPDLGDAGDDIVGCDTLLGLGFCYNADNSDAGYYGPTPPALGYDFFQGPLVFTGDMADTAKMWNFTRWPGYVNMSLLSFNKYINGTDPNSNIETYNYQQGLNSDGSEYLYDGQSVKFFHSGDPITGEGDIDEQPADRRFMQSTGNIDFRPGDSTEIFFGQVIGRAADRLTSLAVMKYNDRFAQTAYDLDFDLPEPPAAPVVEATALDGTIALEWGYDSELEPGDFAFEGYTVLQGESSTGPWTRLATYDVNNGVATILDDVLDPFTGVLEVRGVKFGTDFTLKHHYGTSTDKLTGLALHNHTTYYFRVEAYSFDDTQTPKTLTSATIVSVTPHAPTAGSDLPTEFGDVFEFAHPTGTSDGSIAPIVIDPEDITGHDYMVVFDSYYDADEDVDVPYWRLIDVTLDVVLLDSVTNQTGDNDYQIVDGMQLKVLGPPAEGKDFTYVSASPVNVSPIAASENGYAGGDRWFTAATGSGGELLFGGVYMEPNFIGATTVGPGDMATVEIRWRPMASFTDLDGDGLYTPGETYTVDDAGETQSAFMYTAYGSGASYEGFFPVPFTAWDVTDPANPRQLNVAVRDRDQNQQWDVHYLADPPDVSLPNDGDIQYNYTFILNSDYDATGAMYGDGTGGTLNFWDNGSGLANDLMWTMWLGERGSSRGVLAEECTLTLVPNIVNTPADTFTFSTSAPDMVTSGSEADLKNIKTVPNPYYAYGPYDGNKANRKIKFIHLPPKATIRIFNLGGDLVQTVEHPQDGNTVPDEASWNTLTANNIPVASGIYLYVVDAPGFGTKIGKMAVFTEIEILDTF